MADELPPLPAHLDPRRTTRTSRHGGGGHDRHFRFKQISLYSTATIATLLSIVIVVGTGIYWWNYREFNQGINKISISSSDNVGPNTPKDIDGKDQNILIVGNDDRSTATDAELRALKTGRDGGSLLTDSMMLIHVPADGRKATLISFPRDSYVAIPGYGMNKLNSAYADAYNAANGTHEQKVAAGANLLVRTIENLTALHVDHYVQVDLIGFVRISDAIGGIKVNMCEAVNDPATTTGGSGFKAAKGPTTISGPRALAFVRQRYNYPLDSGEDGDFGRIKRQQYFLTAAFRQVFSGNVFSKIQKLFGAVKQSITVDGNLDPLDLGRQMQNLTANNISAQESIPWDGFNNDSPVGSVVVVHPAQVQTFVFKLIGATDPKLKTATLVDPSTVTVSVLNAGSGENSTAQTNATVLQKQGFSLGTVGDSPDPVTATTIQYAEGMQDEAKTLAQYVPGALLMKTNVKALTLLLGPDGLKAKPLPKPAQTSTGTPS
ncbi:MAG TPA: LCP family protein, partial [Jatrophihabitans sp.]